ncbi:MAG: hypothetical protein QXG37_13980 [Saccharolobus sp.]
MYLEEPLIDCLKLLNIQYIDLTTVHNNRTYNVVNIPDLIVEDKIIECKNWNNHYKITKYLVINEILSRFHNYLDRDKILIITNPNWDIGSKKLLLDHGIKIFELNYFVSRDIWLNHYCELVYNLLFILSKIFKIPLTHEDAVRLIKEHLGHLYDIPKYWDNVGKNDSENGSKEKPKMSGYLDINKAISGFLGCVSVRECFWSVVPRVFSRFKLWLWMVKSRLRSVLDKLNFTEKNQKFRVDARTRNKDNSSCSSVGLDSCSFFSDVRAWFKAVRTRFRNRFRWLKFKENCQNGRVEPQAKAFKSNRAFIKSTINKQSLYIPDCNTTNCLSRKHKSETKSPERERYLCFLAQV